MNKEELHIQAAIDKAPSIESIDSEFDKDIPESPNSDSAPSSYTKPVRATEEEAPEASGSSVSKEDK